MIGCRFCHWVDRSVQAMNHACVLYPAFFIQTLNISEVMEMPDFPFAILANEISADHAPGPDCIRIAIFIGDRSAARAPPYCLCRLKIAGDLDHWRCQLDIQHLARLLRCAYDLIYDCLHSLFPLKYAFICIFQRYIRLIQREM